MIAAETVDRDELREKLHAALQSVIAPDKATSGIRRDVTIIEIYGLRGQGKSHMLAEAREICREEKVPWALFRFENAWLEYHPMRRNELLSSICNLLERDIPGIHDAYSHAIAAQADSSDPDRVLRDVVDRIGKTLADALREMSKSSPNEGRIPLALLFDNVEFCSDELFSWLGNELLLPFQAAGVPLCIFLGGRGQKVLISGWEPKLKDLTESYPLAPLDFAGTQAHLSTLPPRGVYHKAAEHIYEVSNGHPYSNKSLVERLQALHVPIEDVPRQREDLARYLHEEVIRRYILAQTEDWVMPLIEVACILRRFNPPQLHDLAHVYDPALAEERHVMWYWNRLPDLYRAPFHLGIQGDQHALEPTLRRLMHTALAILKTRKVEKLHRAACDIWERSLSDPETRVACHTAVQEYLYHLTQIETIHGRDASPLVRQELDRLLNRYFKPGKTQDDGWLLSLCDRLSQDSELIYLLGSPLVNQLIAQVRHFLTQSPTTGTPRTPFIKVTIEFDSPSEYTVSWQDINGVPVRERTHTELKFALHDWRAALRSLGKTAFVSYLPEGARAMLVNRPGVVLLVETDVTDIPWELLHDGREFLCLDRPMARMPLSLKQARQHQRPEDSKTRRALVIGNPTGDLPEAEVEANEIKTILEGGGFVVDLFTGEEATLNLFSVKLATEWYDLVHFAGHADFMHGASRLSALRFYNNKLFPASSFEHGMECSAFVFLNACEASRSETVEVTAGYFGKFIEGLTTSVIFGGGTGSLGPMWKVSDTEAKAFALAFYRHLVAGKPVGEAVRLARHDLRKDFPDSESWAAWFLYGDPTLELV